MSMVHNCGTPVILDLNRSFDFYSFFNQEGNTLKVTTMFIRTRSIIPVYYCQDCRREVAEDELRIECGNCHKIFPPTFTMMTPYDSLVCKDCVQEFGILGCKPYKLPRYQKDKE